MGAYKQFSQALFDKHDGVAVDQVLRQINAQGSFAMRNDDKYGPDIVVFNSENKACLYVEVEHRNKWLTGPFPWQHVHVLERKTKYFSLGLPLEFWVLSNDLQFAVVINDYVITWDKLQEVPNSQVAQGELMYRIPIEECEHRELLNAETCDLQKEEATQGIQ